MRIDSAAALVTGGNRGLGDAFVQALLARGAKVYAAARDRSSVTRAGAIPVRLDVTDEATIDEARRSCADVSLVVNNAGIVRGQTFLGAPSLDDARAEMETNYFGTLAVARAFAPVLARNGGGALVNVLSIASFVGFPAAGSQAASKSAAWSATHTLRMELRDQGTLVVGVHAGFIDTGPDGMAAGITAPKLAMSDVVDQTLDAVEAGREEVLVGERTRAMKAALPRDLEDIYPEVERQWRATR